jgi:hypothetical protein
MMTIEQPWDVRHIYSKADPDFLPYLDHLDEKLRKSREARWIRDLHDCPVDQDSGIRPALLASGWAELVIVDLHGWTVEQGPWLCTTTTTTGILLRDLPADSWSASAIFLTGCRGGTREFAAELDRILTRRTTVVSHIDEADFSDHTPVDLITAVLGQTAGADAGEVFNVVKSTLYDRRPYAREKLGEELWTVDRLGPVIPR